MDAERLRAMLLKLPDVVETLQWGANLVFWIAGREAGGRTFAVVDLDERGGPVISYAAGPERFAELVEREGIRPAPYFARACWVAVERWDVLRASEWQSELSAAHALVFAKLPKRLRESLTQPPAARGKWVSAKKTTKPRRKPSA